MSFLLLDVSFGFFDLVFMNPLAAILVLGLGILLIWLGVKAIRRELKKKKGQPEAAAPAVDEMLLKAEPVIEGEPLPEGDQPADEERDEPGDDDAQ